MQNMTETCTTLGGQIIELKNVRLTCKPSGNSTHTVLEVIPECVGGVCTEDEVGDLKDDYLDDLLDTALEDFDGASYCVIDDSSEAVKSLSVIGRTVLVIALSVFFSVV